ncbi:50S ribosomal protein L29 [Patescibacteria group bacterium]|nr:50S ribosomal protein L29 [Patescibacteria group bacterium]
MKAKDIRKKSGADLTKELTELETELREFRFGMSGGRTKNVKRARAIRKDIARIKTVMSESNKA